MAGSTGGVKVWGSWVVCLGKEGGRGGRGKERRHVSSKHHDCDTPHVFVGVDT